MMRDPTTAFTLTDIDVGCRLAEALVVQVNAGEAAPITHEDLLTLARSLHPKDVTLGRAVPVGIGMKLRFVGAFCEANGYPGLACLAVDKATMQPGADYRGDWDAERRAVAGFDWNSAKLALEAFAAALRAQVPRRFKLRKERPADVAWYAYFCSHREACKDITGEDKAEIINLLMSGLDPESALKRVRAAKGAGATIAP
jgi:hypothetical protein